MCGCLCVGVCHGFQLIVGNQWGYYCRVLRLCTETAGPVESTLNGKWKLMVLPTSLPIASLYCNHYATCLSVACIAMNARCNWPSGMVPVRLACDQCGSIPRDTMLNKSKIVFSTISCISKWSGTTFQTNTRFVNRLHTIKTHKRCNEPNITALPPVKLEICLRKHTSNS